MRNLLLSILWLWLALGMAACYDDDSSLGENFIPDIMISPLRDTTIVSYKQNVLEITPQVVTEYDESELSYGWYIYNANSGMTTTGEPTDGFRSDTIGTQKTLSYEVNLPSGTYGIILEVKADKYNYSRTARMNLFTVTEVSHGYYILKETAGGGTDLDLVSTKGFRADLLTEKYGAPLEGKPVNLSVVYGQGFIDEESLDVSYCKAVEVFSEKDFRAFRAEDFAEVHNKESIFYGGGHEDEELYSMVQTITGMYLLTDRGYYETEACGSTGWFGISCSGKYAFPESTGGSKHCQLFRKTKSGSLMYWNSTDRALYLTTDRVPYELPEEIDTLSLECMASGTNFIGGVETVWFLVHDAANNRCLIVPKWIGEEERYEVEVTKIDPAQRFAKAEIMAGNTREATIIYFVSDNKLWAYNIISKGEFEIPLPQAVEGTICYVSNPFLNIVREEGNSVDFKNLLVATDTGEGYCLYVYENLRGGVPQGSVEPYRGKGDLKSVRYLYGGELTLGDIDETIYYGNGPVMAWTD